jgi:hypothetical protein
MFLQAYANVNVGFLLNSCKKTIKFSLNNQNLIIFGKKKEIRKKHKKINKYITK